MAYRRRCLRDVSSTVGNLVKDWLLLKLTARYCVLLSTRVRKGVGLRVWRTTGQRICPPSIVCG